VIAATERITIKTINIKIMKTITKLVLLLFLGSVAFVNAQEKKEEKTIDPGLCKKSDDYMNRQQEALLKEVFSVVDANPPTYPPARIRQTALYLFDAITHDKYAAFRKPFQDTFHERMEKAITEIENTQVDEGARIWKLYNMGFVVKTKSMTIVFDLVRGVSAGAEGFVLSDDIIKRFAKQCDVLFVSHWHDDHQDIRVAQIFLDEGKPVVASPQIWKDDPIYSKILHPERIPNKVQEIPFKGGKEKLKIVVYPGHQMKKTINNVTLVLSPEGINFAHLGDQINEGDFMVDFDWIDKVKDHYKVDFMMPTVWANDLVRIADGFNPKMIFIGHEDEMGHKVYDRDPFWGDTTFSEPSLLDLLHSDYPTFLMVWGESYHYFQK
jgi:L-ascorbate metabolism protein UlaG (beta-lactamase superfamily)